MRRTPQRLFCSANRQGDKLHRELLNAIAKAGRIFVVEGRPSEEKRKDQGDVRGGSAYSP